MTSLPPSTLSCRHFGSCGGCDRLDVPIERQLADKQAHAAALLAPFLDGLEPAVTLPPRAPRHDRIAILYPVQPHRHRHLQLGIYRRGSHDLEEIADCRIQMKALTTLGVRAGEVLRDLRLPAYDEGTGKGLVRAFRARVMPGSNELLLGCVVTTSTFSQRRDLCRELLAAAAGLRDEQGRALRTVGVVLNVNDRPGNVLLGATSTALHGEPFQTDAIGDLRLRVSFASFYQLSRHSDAILFRPALAMLGDVTGLRVVDGYGGIGSFGCRLLRAGAAQVTIVESSPQACADARVNLEANGLQGGEVREQPFGSAPLPEADLWLLDPPRAGLGEAGAGAVLAAAPPRVLLVSCALASLARDLALLTPRYRVAASRLCDLFPHTGHVEALTLLERR
ncbi:MAG: class I SAM-dependent RNA methyltransferase [Planctomycetes bacterium]|nr:class I SAM-dependent RNA methyltransferase [Planctomycetota bacterium]MCB9886155.1 class I SAM-dependent RNA methyltransferase [Planctomycetota bacterium]